MNRKSWEIPICQLLVFIYARWHFFPLGLPANNPFWCDPVEPWTGVKAFSGLEFPIDKFIKP